MTYKKPNPNFYTLGIALVILLVYVLGIFFPDYLWSTHFLAFLTTPIRMLFVAISVMFFSFPYFFKKMKEPNFELNTSLILIVSSISVFSFYYFQIANDYYGDAKNFSPFLKDKITQIPEELWNDLFSIKLETGNARWGVFKLYSLISYYFAISIGQTFDIINALCGGVFVFTWLLFVQRHITNQWKQLCLIVLGVTTPTLLIFFGHIEVYAFSYTLILIWLLLCISIFKSKNKIHLWLLILLSIFCFRFNTVFVLFLPLHLLLFAHTYLPEKRNVLFQLKSLFLIIHIPLLLIGSYFYFFVFKDHSDSRTLDTNVPGLDRLFLPLFSPEKPLDTYNLLSFNHFFDFGMVIFFWSPIFIFLAGYMLFERKKIDWNTPIVSSLLVTLITVLAFLFMINPLMSLPMDWDLYCLPVPLAFILLAFAFEQLPMTTRCLKKLFFYSSGLGLLCIPYFIVLFTTKMHSYRMESVGIHVYKTYYLHSDSYMLYALQMLEDKELYKSRKENLITKLKPFTKKPYDIGFSNLLLDEGINYYSEKQFEKARNLLLSALIHDPSSITTRDFLNKTNLELYTNGFITPKHHKASSDSLITAGLFASRKMNLNNKALSDFERAIYYDPTNPSISMGKMQVFFKLKNYEKALNAAKQLIGFSYPSEKKALRFGIHCALEAEKYDEALSFSLQYLEIWNEDPFITSIYNDLTNNNMVSKLKFKFAQN